MKHLFFAVSFAVFALFSCTEHKEETSEETAPQIEQTETEEQNAHGHSHGEQETAPAVNQDSIDQAHGHSHDHGHQH